MPKKTKKKDTPPARTPKEEKLFQNLLRITEQFMTGKGYTPLTEQQLMDRLSLPPQHLPLFKDVLLSLLSRKLIEFTNNLYSWKKSNLDVVTGIIRMHPRGFGFVQADNPSLHPQDIFIPKHLTKNAVDGDFVEVLINQDSYSEKGPEGKVLAILSRARTHMAGIIRSIHRDEMIAYAPLLGQQQRIVVQHTPERVLQVGDRIVMEIIDWGSKETETVCRFSHFLGHISDPSCDINAAIEEYELRGDFPSKAIEEAESFGTRVSPKDLHGRVDLRALETFTIDPDTAKDFDDAISLSQDAEGYYDLAVHIADVSHYVKIGSAIDVEAQMRGNSTYFPRYCLPMIPSALSDNLCSLRANVIRLTISVLMRFDSHGEMISHKIVKSYIKSQKRFTYREAKEVLDGKIKSPHSPTLQLMVKMCHLLKKKRYERGSIEFALPELSVLVDEQGLPYSTDYIVYDITHQMVEEFMLKANEVVALDLTQRGKNLTYRVHDEPAEENLKDFSLLAGAFGFRLPEKPKGHDFQKLFEEAADTPYGNYLASSYIRRMRLAVYSAENIGHYGLSLSHYCHFTSPIRRYVDLVVHRILFGETDDLEYLTTIAAHCSEQERISARAETSVVLLKKLRLLDSIHKKDPYKDHEAIITRVKNFGFYFEIIDLLIEGFIHIAELEEDYFVFEESRMRLRGTRKGMTYAPGDKITVILQSVDLIYLEAKWYLTAKTSAGIQPVVKKQKKKPTKNVPGKTILKRWAKKKAKGQKVKAKSSKKKKSKK